MKIDGILKIVIPEFINLFTMTLIVILLYQVFIKVQTKCYFSERTGLCNMLSGHTGRQKSL